MSQDEPHLHFSFPSADTMDSLVIDWPSGVTQTFTDLPTNRHFRIREPETTNESVNEVSKPNTLFTRSPIKISEETHSVEEYYDLYAKQPLIPFDETWSGPKIELADLNNDGWLDLVMGGSTG